MATRLNRHHSAETRAKIKAGQLVNELQNNVLGRRVRKKVEGKWQVITEKDYLSDAQVRSIGMLLNKIVPDLSRVELSNDPESGPLRVTVEGVPSRNAKPVAKTSALN